MDKPVRWVGQTRKELQAMPEEVRDEIGYSLYIAQQGGRPENAVRMKGSLRSVTEIRVHEASDTYRAMYTTELKGVIYVLDVFKKKSKKGIATPKADLNRILARLKVARMDYDEVGPPEDEQTQD